MLTPTFKDQAGLGSELMSIDEHGHGCEKLDKQRAWAASMQAKPANSLPRTPTIMITPTLGGVHS